MPPGIYKHKPNQGYQKGHKSFHTEESRRKIGLSRLGKKRPGIILRGEAHPSWKGGLPKCLSCGERVKDPHSIRCRACWFAYKKDKAQEYAPIKQAKRLWNNKLRQDRKRGAIGAHTAEQWEMLRAQYNFMCLSCMRFEPEIKLTEDHILPLSKDGSNHIFNIQPLCKSCNSIKGTNIIDFAILNIN